MSRRLSDWSNELRWEFARLLADNYTVADAERAFYKNHPDARVYPYVTLLAYRNSDQGKKEISEIRSGYQAEAKDGPLVHRGERLRVLVETLEIILSRLRMVYEAGAALKTPDMTRLSGEVRALIAEIRTEAAPYDEDAVVAGSPLEKFFEQLKKVPQELRPLILSDSEDETEKSN